MSLEREITISNESKNLSQVRRLVSEVLEETSFDREMRNKIIVAVDEALANVVEHAYQGGQGDIRIGFALDAEVLQVMIRDNGTPFDPGDRLRDTVDIHNHIKLGLKGGLGLFLMRRIMDEVRYSRDGEDFVNELRMIKRLPEASADAASAGVGQEPGA